MRWCIDNDGLWHLVEGDEMHGHDQGLEPHRVMFRPRGGKAWRLDLTTTVMQAAHDHYEATRKEIHEGRILADEVLWCRGTKQLARAWRKAA